MIVFGGPHAPAQHCAPQVAFRQSALAAHSNADVHAPPSQPSTTSSTSVRTASSYVIWKVMRRWLVLISFTLVAGVSQMLWLNYAPVLTAIQAHYHISELLASTLILVFPGLYVLLSLPAGK